MAGSTKLLLQVIAKKTNKIPIWFMRQAGRYLPEYRDLKKTAGGFLQICTEPKLAAEISLQPIRRFDLDAVILFSDILTPLIPMGIEIDFQPAPVIKNTINSLAGIKKLKLKPANQELAYVGETLKLIKKQLPKNKCIIGFAGAPFTLACYLMKKQSDKDFSAIKKFCLTEPDNYFVLAEKLEQLTVDYLSYQIESGAELVQLFDSWAGIFSQADYKKFVLPSVQKIIKKLKSKFTVPIIYYVNYSSHLLDELLETGADVLSLDWRVDLKLALAKIKTKKKNILLQGNLDPFYLFTKKQPLDVELKRLAKIFESENWIFNLGQGIDKETPIKNIHSAIETLRKIR